MSCQCAIEFAPLRGAIFTRIRTNISFHSKNCMYSLAKLIANANASKQDMAKGRMLR